MTWECCGITGASCATRLVGSAVRSQGAGRLVSQTRALSADNLHRFGVYTLLTSTGGWDTGRAITNGIAIVVLGPAILTTLRRAARRASYGTTPTLVP